VIAGFTPKLKRPQDHGSVPLRKQPHRSWKGVQICVSYSTTTPLERRLVMSCFRSVRELRRWAVASLAAVAFALVDFDGSVWAFEAYPDGHICPLRAIRSNGVYS
jgi:hypothetical protein